jgi:hypothetical protein
MNQVFQQTRMVNSNDNTKWYNSPVKLFEGTLTEIDQYIPYFERRAFTTVPFNIKNSGVNERLDTIVRLPTGEDNNYIPVGVVSKNYTLVQHRTVLDVLVSTLISANIEQIEDLRVTLKITEYGERMSLSILLPQKYNFTPSDSHSMALRLVCFNSVEGSAHFRAIMGWFRFVCSNGLVIGVTRYDVRHRHLADKKNFEYWQKTKITLYQLAPWINKNLRQKWGFKAAARAYHIARNGYDAEINGSYQNTTPITIKMNETIRVQGTPSECRNLYDLSQILAWLAKERNDIQEQLEWQEAIPDLIATFTN